MAQNKTPPPPTQKQVDKHWGQQERAVSRPLYETDPGVSIVTTQGEASRIIDAAREGATVPAFRLRNADGIVDDPLARTATLLKKAHGGMPREDFAALVSSTLDQQCYLALYGQMSDYQRAQIWQRIHKQAFDEQQAALAEAHRRHQLDQKQADQMLKGISMQQRIQEAEAKRKAQGGQ
ncbi:hypothetical protein DM806_13705 [Sphingobium lactosutens]|uniref:hypothetical protein n=1 Tax=Sphingobium lactosutens TaxID=522773 RepID=UPI0015C11E1E|nr:hypothetical protein [Sphingobium lactosutens]NWK96696.1 hypothetical protein [Sphingobium lactosutens]